MTEEVRKEKLNRLAEEVLKLTRDKIIVKQRFLDVAIHELWLLPTFEIRTFATDGRHMFYHPEYVLKCYKKGENVLIRDYLHILMHCIFRHFFVDTHVSHVYWNLACDIAVEAVLRELETEIEPDESEKIRQKEIEKLQKEIKCGNEFESYIANLKLQHLQAQFVAGYAEIPNKNLQVFSMFGKNETKAIDVDYDRIVFDTYDYLDKIIGFKLSDIFYAAFNEYFEKTDDLRAKRMAQLVKYGTEDEKEIMMLRYGFSFEDIEWLEPYIKTINQEEIIFSRKIEKLPIEKMNVIKRFI